MWFDCWKKDNMYVYNFAYFFVLFVSLISNIFVWKTSRYYYKCEQYYRY